MLKKLSYRDTPEELVAVSIYYSSLAARALKDIPSKFPGYDDVNSAQHDMAVDAVLHSLDGYVTRAAEAHGVDKKDVMLKLKRMVSEGIA